MSTVKDNLKLLKIKQRRFGMLRKQLSKIGAYATMAVTIETEIEDIGTEIEELESELRRKLQKYKEQEAVTGINTDPAILIYIEDIEAYFLHN